MIPRRRLSRSKSRVKKSEAVVDVHHIAKEGFLSSEKLDKPVFNFDLLPLRKKYWYVLSGTSLFAIASQPKDEKGYAKVVSVIDLITVKEIKVEGASIIFEMNSKRNRRKVNAAGYDPRKIVSERKEGKAHVLRAESNSEALKWVQAIQTDGDLDASRRNLEVRSSNKVFAEAEAEKKSNGLTVSKLVVKDMRTRKEVFQTRQVLAGGAVPVKLLVGSMPPEFRLEVTVVDGEGMEVDGNSEVFYMDELLELNGDRDAYGDRNISLNFEINGAQSEIKVYIQFARENLAKYELISFEKRFERLFLEYVLFNIPQPYLSLIFFACLFIILLPILRPFESLLFSIPTALGLYPYVPRLEDFLLNRLQPYFVAHVSLKTKAELDAAREARLANREPDVSITAEELALVDELRGNLQPVFDGVPSDSFAHEVMDKYINYDFRLVRFVRARNGDLTKAAAMVEKAMKWRIEYESDNIVDDSKDGESFIPMWLLTYAGAPQVSELLRLGSGVPPLERCAWFLRDKDSGNLAVLIRSGRNNWRQVYKKLGETTKDAKDTLFSYLIYIVQWAREAMDALHMETNGKTASYITFVADLKGMKMSNQIPTSDLVSLARRFLPIFFTCYPELLHRVLVINAPTVFYTLFSMVKRFIPKRVLQKFMIHGKSKNLDNLARVLDMNEIPKSYGGKMVINGDEMCFERIPSWGPFQEDEGKPFLEY